MVLRFQEWSGFGNNYTTGEQTETRSAVCDKLLTPRSDFYDLTIVLPSLPLTYADRSNPS